MEKLNQYVVKEGLKLGDFISEVLPNGHYAILGLLKKQEFEALVEAGILTEVQEKVDTSVPITYFNGDNVTSCVVHLAERIKWGRDNLEKYLTNLHKIQPSVVFSILLREYAIMIDERYKDHVERSKEIYSIAMNSGEIRRVPINRIKNFKNFAAFRTVEDALEAKAYFNNTIKTLFKRGG